MRNYDAEYPIVMKSNKTFNSTFCHSNHFIIDSDALNELFSNDKLPKEELVIEELVLHSEDWLLKYNDFQIKLCFGE